MAWLVKQVMRRPWLYIGAAVALTIILGAFIPRLQFDASITTMIPEDDPVLDELLQVTQEFGSQELFAVAVRAENVYTADTLGKIAALENAISDLPGVSQVDSPLNVQLVESGPWGLDIRPVAARVPETSAELAQFRQDFERSPYAGRLITDDGCGAMLLVQFEPWDDDAKKAVVSEIEQIVHHFPGPEELHVVGDLYVFSYTETAMQRDLQKLVPFVVVVIIIVLYLTFRSALGVVVPLLTVFTSLVWTIGLMAFFEVPVSLISMALPVILLTLGIASGIHILNKYQELLEKGLPKNEALEQTFQTIASPVIMAALTTSAGFASLLTAFVRPIREFGVFTAFGVAAAMALSLTVVPAILTLVSPPTKKRRSVASKRISVLTRLLEGAANLALRRRSLIIGLAVLLLLVMTWGASMIQLESNIVNYFDKRTPIRQGTGIVEDVFGGSMQLAVVFDAGEPDGIKEPAVLHKMAQVQEYLNSFPTINHAMSIVDLLKLVNQALWDGDPEYYVIPASREAVAQQLLLFTMQGGTGLDGLVSYDYQQGIINAQMKTLDAQELARVISAVEQYLIQEFGSDPNLSVRVTGTPKVMMRLMDRYVQTQISSLVTSTIFVGLIVILLMKSFVLGLLCLIPLFFTVAVNFGVMGFTGIPLDAVTSIIASLIMGIGVDYAVHYISRFLQERRTRHNFAEAIYAAGISAGRAIVYNAVALVAGFLVLGFSESFRAIALFGYLMALTMVVSSAAALVIIPVMLGYFEHRTLERGRNVRRTALVLILTLVLALGVPVWAAELSGDEILDQVDSVNLLAGSGSAELEMTTENANGSQRSYGLKIFRKQEDGRESQLLEYLSPADVRGTKFLSIKEGDEPSQMWLYMPALGRERRIAANMTGDKFMGTDFTYDEIAGDLSYAEQYRAERLADDVLDGKSVYVLKLIPTTETPYGSIIMWVQKDPIIPLRIELFGIESGVMTKTLELGEYREVDEQLIPHYLEMRDELANTRTILHLVEISSETISDDVFSLRYLRR